MSTFSVHKIAHSIKLHDFFAMRYARGNRFGGVRTVNYRGQQETTINQSVLTCYWSDNQKYYKQKDNENMGVDFWKRIWYVFERQEYLFYICARNLFKQDNFGLPIKIVNGDLKKNQCNIIM
jgi:hypothetical protein